MQLKNLVSILLLVTSLWFWGGCAFSRHEIIPQKDKGPHGGMVYYLDSIAPEYIEFVVTPEKKEWLFQLYSYSKKFKPREFTSYAILKITLPDGTEKEAKLWNTKRFFWPFSKKVGHLENRIELGDAKELRGAVILKRNRRGADCFMFYYPTRRDI